MIVSQESRIPHAAAPLRSTAGRLAPVLVSFAFLCLVITGCVRGNLRNTLSVKQFPTAVSSPGNGRDGTALLIEPQDGVGPLVRSIDASTETVFLETYILTQRRVIRSLQRAAAQGVTVDVLLDRRPFGMGNQPGAVAAALRAAGVAVRWASTRYYYTHAKFLVLDDRLAVVSTANFSQSAFTRNRELLVLDRQRRDVHDLSNTFRSDWDHLSFHTTNADLILSPGARPMLAAFLTRAMHSIDIYAEEVADPLLDALLVRLSRRVHVKVLVAAGYRSRGVAQLMNGGVEIRALSHPYIHAKMFLVDGGVAFVGSENLSPTSLDANREVGTLIRGATVARAAHVFDLDWARATPLRTR